MEGKVVPYSLQAEQSVLGSILLSKDAIVMVTDIITEEDFYKEFHQEIFSAMLQLNKKSEPIDLITLLDKLEKEDLSAEQITYITDLTSVPDFTDNIISYAKIVKEKSMLRALIQASQNIIEKSYREEIEVMDILNYAEKQVFDVAQEQNIKGLIPIDHIMLNKFDSLERLAKHKGDLTGITSGFTDLDRKTNGFQSTDLILIAARPSMGKTAFSLNLVANAAIKGKASVAVFSLEMSNEQLVDRMIAANAQVELSNIRNGSIKDEEWEKVTNAMGLLSSHKI